MVILPTVEPLLSPVSSLSESCVSIGGGSNCPDTCIFTEIYRNKPQPKMKTPKKNPKKNPSSIQKGKTPLATLKQQVIQTFKKECQKAVQKDDLKCYVYLRESLSDMIADQVCENGDDVDEEDWSELAELISEELEEEGIMDENHEIIPNYFVENDEN